MSQRHLMNNVPSFLRRPNSAKRRPIDDTTTAYRPLLALWLVEMAIHLRWYHQPRPNRLPDIFSDEDFLDVSGIESPGEKDDDGDIIYRTKVTESSFLRLLKKRLSILERTPLADDLPLFKNTALIGRLLNLSDAEKAVLTMATAVEEFPRFRDAIAARNERVSNRSLSRLLGLMTGQPEDEIRLALREDSVLTASGILNAGQDNRDLERKLDIPNGLGGLLLQPDLSEERLTQRFLKKASPATLRLTAFPHLAQDIHVLLDYLRNALQSRETAVNILFYGPPGTGKTELAKAIASQLEASLFEIPFADGDGDPIRGKQRLRAYTFSQRLLERRDNTLLMFDEVEDVFDDFGSLLALFGSEDEATSRTGKAWINRTLERNCTPAIWITNNPNFDTAYLRRFDYSVRFPIPPQKVRLEIARHHLGDICTDEDWLSHIAASEQTTPAQIERAAKVARIANRQGAEQSRELVEQTIDRSATLLNQKCLAPRNRRRTSYDLRFINTDVDLGKLIANLQRRPHGSFCFYGPAGTGKSELARHIADELGLPIIVRRASDILSMWVGEAEKNIAAMFADARQQQALLVLDEADSFLADRRDAQRSWEVTQVNELLTQMEAFDGLFVCTTNLIQKLDQASLRRFSFKLKFGYLNVEQRWQMFCEELARQGGDPAAAAEWKTPVCRLENLTPGDFAVAARQYEVWGTAVSAGELYESLRRECAAKEGASRGIGFTA